MRRTMLALLLLLGAAVGRAQTPLDKEPGYFPLEEMAILQPADLSVEINLQGAMLRMIAAATEDDPEFSRLVGGLKAIRVQIAEDPVHDPDGVRERARAGVRWLQARGWTTVVRVVEPDDEVQIFVKEQDGQIEGLTLFAFESSEVTVINLIGTVNPEDVGALARGLDLPQLERAVGGEPEPEEEEQ